MIGQPANGKLQNRVTDNKGREGKGSGGLVEALFHPIDRQETQIGGIDDGAFCGIT